MEPSKGNSSVISLLFILNCLSKTLVIRMQFCVEIINNYTIMSSAKPYKILPFSKRQNWPKPTKTALAIHLLLITFLQKARLSPSRRQVYSKTEMSDAII